ncbi:DUF4132 domain-containing protein [Pseudomonas indica]|uniref:DUF4132 domain-containing protein n=1 Tax=Pseudomonas indica TaxID=137658 RepID=UPI0023F65F09|nr:DUF4132 domain-containing protein [Pseudomonas indica]MBU3058558.1 DUF4132 domain-containing protein [Pseudomonas indica]
MIDRNTRVKALVALSDPEDDAGFLDRLERIYREHAIGEGLPFAGVAAYCRGEAELPRPWRQALAQAACLDPEGGVDYWLLTKGPARLHPGLVADVPLEDWLRLGERCVVLLAPLLNPADLCHWLLPEPAASPVTLQARAWLDSQVEAMQAWAHDLAAGRAGWDGVHRWLSAAGADPGSLAAALDAADPRHWYDAPLRGLLGVRVLLTLAREQLQRDVVPDDAWIDLLNCCRKSIVAGLKEPVPYKTAASVRHHCTLPLLRTLAASPRLAEAFAEPPGAFGEAAQTTLSWSLRELFGGLGLGLLLAEPLDAFRGLLARIGTVALRSMQWPEDFAERYPAAALLHQQQLFERCGSFVARVETPEAFAWYRETLFLVPGDTDSFELGAATYARLADDDELDQLVMTCYFPSPGHRLPSRLLDRMGRVDRLRAYLDSGNPELRKAAARRIFELASVGEAGDETGEGPHDRRPATYRRDPTLWPILMAECERLPGPFVETTLDAAHMLGGGDLPERWALLWRVAEDLAPRTRIAEACLAVLCDARCTADMLALAERLFAADPAPFMAYARDEYAVRLEDCLAALERTDSPLRALAPAMVARCLESDSSWHQGDRSSVTPLVRDALAEFPESFTRLDDKSRLRLLPLFDERALAACGEALAQVFAGSAKAVRGLTVALVGRCGVEALERSGLLGAAPKARKLVLTGMALSRRPGLGGLIARHVHDAAHDDYSRSLSLDALERDGHSLQGLDPWAGLDLPALQALSQGQAIPPAVEAQWNEEFGALLAPLGEPLGRYLLAIIHDGGEVLPRKARQILAFLPAGRRSDLALLALNAWIAGNGLNEFNWLLPPLPEYGDERAADALVKAIKDWKKVRTLKAAAAMRLLCQVPGDYGVAQALDLWENGKLPGSINEAARQGLAEAAERREMSLEDFVEQLVPDFGFGPDGLVLDLGPYAYTVRIRPDLNLAVIDPQGKAGKSLPKAKAGEDADKRSLAENRFKAVSKNLKPVLAQQGKRLLRALQTGREWSAEAWRRLFAAHPLLRPVVQGVVWSALGADGTPLKRFRPTESGDLIDLADEPWTLPADARVRVTHPLELDEAEEAAWRMHFADYELASPIGQWEVPVHRAEAEELAATGLARADGSVLNRARFGGLVEKWGYLRGAAGDGGMVREHAWLMDRHWRVTLRHSDINVAFMPDESVAIDGFVIDKWVDGDFHRQRLGELPPAFLNTLLTQAEELKEVAEA